MSMPWLPSVRFPALPGWIATLPVGLVMRMPEKLTPVPMVVVLAAVTVASHSARSAGPGTLAVVQLFSRSRFSVLFALAAVPGTGVAVTAAEGEDSPVGLLAVI